MKRTLLFFCLLLTNWSIGQVGIGTTHPQGALDIVSNDQGIVVPRVSCIENVTDGHGNQAADGTIVYDTSREKTCYRVAGNWICIGTDGSGNATLGVETLASQSFLQYLKASNTEANDQFGTSMDVSDDGSTLAVGAYFESSNATGINGDQANNDAVASGAVYIFRASGGVWTQEGYLKASNAETGDSFGRSVTLNQDGSFLAVGAPNERSNASGVNGDQTNNSMFGAGAVYVFSRSGTTWSQQAFLKASNPGAADYFGISLSLSNDGSYLAVGSYQEDSNATGINGDQTNDLAEVSGAAYVFIRSGSSWSQQAYIKASNTEAFDRFGFSISINAIGNLLAVGATGESSNATGVNGNQLDNSVSTAGAVYLFNRLGTSWVQSAYIKASNSGTGDWFGRQVALSKDGLTLMIGAEREDHDGEGVCPATSTNNNSSNSGAVYIFRFSSGAWSQSAYLKAISNDSNDGFGISLATTADGSLLFVGAEDEDGNGTGTTGDPTNNSATDAGAVYIFQ